jgi:membrane-associated phospholipid phosphatase
MTAAPTATFRGTKRSARPLLPDPWRGRALWLVIAFGLLVVVGGIAVHGDNRPFGIEVRIQNRVDEHAGGDSAWRPVFTDVIPWSIGVVLGALGLWSLAQRWWRGCVACVAVPIAIAVAEWVLKPIVARNSSDDLVHVFPSGHLTGVAATATVLVVLVGPHLSGARLSRSGLATGLQLGLAFVVTAACAVSMVAAIASHAHGVFDTVAGVPTGAAVALAWMLAVDAVAPRLTRRTTIQR